MTTTGITVAVFAVFGLNTSVLINSKDFGAEEVACNASRQVAGDAVSLWDTLPKGIIDSRVRDWVMDPREDIVDIENGR